MTQTVSDSFSTEAVSQPQQTRRLPLEFTGTAGEFFRIWIVNLGLSLITLGIYSAWAKVRTKRYFYGNTWLDRSSFDYLASPITILKGRLISMAVLAVYIGITHFYPVTAPVFGLAFMLLLPWLVVRSLNFNARNSAYRNVTFSFNGSVGEAYLCFLVFPLLTIFTLGLAYPAVIARQKRFFINNSGYGQSPFKLDVKTSTFFSIYIQAFLIILLAMGASYFLASLSPIVSILITYGAYLIAFTLITVQVTNLILNNTQLDEQQFSSNLETGKLVTIYLTNTIGIICSLGLLIPWAMIRTARYRVECTRMIAHGSLDTFIQAEQKRASALGEEFSDLMDVEFGL